jgi:hypothetical protein
MWQTSVLATWLTSQAAPISDRGPSPDASTEDEVADENAGTHPLSGALPVG